MHYSCAKVALKVCYSPGTETYFTRCFTYAKSSATCFHSFLVSIYSLAHSFFSLMLRSFVCTFVHLVGWLVSSFVRSFVRSLLIHSFLRWFIRLLILYICLICFIDSSIYSYILNQQMFVFLCKHLIPFPKGDKKNTIRHPKLIQRRFLPSGWFSPSLNHGPVVQMDSLWFYHFIVLTYIWSLVILDMEG